MEDITLYIGYAFLIIGYILFLIAAYEISPVWCLACFVIAPVSLLFLIMHWSEARSPFFVQVIGAVLVYVNGGFDL